MQQITISGYLSKDGEVRTTQNGDQIANWNVPVRQGFGDREATNWFRVSIWGKRAEYAAKARKGEFVVVTGELMIGEYQGKPQYEIRAGDFRTVRPAPRDGSQGAPVEPQRDSRQSMADELSDDIPFLTANGVW